MNRLPRVLTVLFDYVALVFASCLGAIVAVALMVWRNPDPNQVMDHGLPLVVAATGLALVLFWFGAGKGPWFSGHPGRRPGAAAVILVAGVVAGMWIRYLMLSYKSSGAPADLLWSCFQIAAFLLVLIGLFALRHAGLRRGWWTGRARAGLAAVLVISAIYLGWDEPEASVVRDNAAVFLKGDHDEESYRLTLRYSPEPGGGLAFFPLKSQLRFPADAAKRREYLVAHRSEIEADWESLSEVRVWWEEMAAHDSLGDRSAWSVDQPFVRFAPIRAYQQTALAMAELQALDGDGDGAFARVMEVYKVGANLEASTCTLIRGMISVVVQKEALRAAVFVLDEGAVSAEARGRMGVLLEKRPGAEAGIGRMLLSEAMYASSSIRVMGDATCGPLTGGWRQEAWRFVGAGIRWLAFNPQATINLMHENTARASALADARRLEELRSMEEGLNDALLGGCRVKNIGGRMMLTLMFPAYQSVAKNYWEKEDRRAELAARLRD